MIEHRQHPPLVQVDQSLFEVHISLNKIIDPARQGAEISFNDMTYTGNGYQFRFDRKKQLLAAPFDIDSQEIIDVTIEQRTALDPIGMADTYGYMVQDILNKSDFQVIVDQELYQKRISGELPALRFFDFTYLADLENSRLISVVPTRPNLQIGIHAACNYFDPIILYYNERTQKSEDECAMLNKKVPSEVRKISLPSPIEIDAVFVARSAGWPEENTLLRYPPHRHLEAMDFDQGTPRKSFIRVNQKQKKTDKRACNSKGKKI